MLRNKTTLLIGAGASCDLGFPMGDGLHNLIIELLAFEDPNRSVNLKDQMLLPRRRCLMAAM